MSCSKYSCYALEFILLFPIPCSATTGVFVVTPDQIVAGIDRMANTPNPDGKLTISGAKKKIALLRGRFIVACVGIESLKVGPPPQTLVYDFSTWIKGIESQISDDSSVTTLVNIIERESTKTFRSEIPIEEMMKDGELQHIKALDKYLVHFEVAGFDHSVVWIIEISYELDWKNNVLVGPEREVKLPSDNITVAVYDCGRYDFIKTDQLTDPHSYAHKRIAILAPEEFRRISAFQPISRTEAIRLVRALITIEGEVEPREVGMGAAVVVLPISGTGTVMEYQTPPSVGKKGRKAN